MDEALAGLVVHVALLGALVAALVEGIVRLARLRERNLRAGIASLLDRIRREQGLPGFDREDAKRHAAQVLTAASRGDARPESWEERYGAPRRWAPHVEPDRFARFAVRVLPDFEDLARELESTLRERFRSLESPLRHRFRRWVRGLTVVAALLVVLLLWPRPLALPSAFSRNALSVDAVAGGLIVALLLVLAAPLWHQGARRARRRLARPEPAPGKPEPPAREEEPVVGRPGELVRAINFGGGGFDTLMQLGVTHALLVIQGRPPDAVVGVSAGAIQAAALAEVLQANEEHDEPLGDPGDETTPLSRSRYEKILGIRVRRYREFLDAARHAPERLIDVLLPDAYEIDARNPLRPLETPVFARRERAGRRRALGTQSGLVRLYNDLLRVPLSLGTITRLIRRVLGLRAAAEIRPPVHDGRHPARERARRALTRYTASLLELGRMWLLFGRSLARGVPFARVLLRPFVRRPSEPRMAHAGTLIFRFRTLEWIGARAADLGVFLLLLGLWLGVSWTPFVVLLVHWENPWPVQASLVATLALVFLWFLWAVIEAEPADQRADAVYGFLKSLVVFGCQLALWSLVALVLLFTGTSLISYGWEAFRDEPLAGLVPPLGSLREFAGYARLALLRLVIVSFGVVVAVAVYLGVFTLRGRQPEEREKSFRDLLLQRYLRRFLRHYHLDEALAPTQPLEELLAGLFDPGFYGRLDLDAAVDDSLSDRSERSVSESESGLREQRKKIREYADERRRHPVHVGITAADVGTGTVEAVSQEASVVEGLTAATAFAPFFRPKRLGRHLYVDATKIGNVPTRALVSLLRGAHPDSRGALIYSVSPFPLSKPDHRRDERYLNLLDIAFRSLQLRRYNDAALEKELTDLYSSVIPPGEHFVAAGDEEDEEARAEDGGKASGKRYFRAQVIPVELDKPFHLWRRVLFAREPERHRAIHELVADGCRAALERMVSDAARSLRVRGEEGVPCRRAVASHRDARVGDGPFAAAVGVELPGSSRSFGPGLAEVCERCALRRGGAEDEAEGRYRLQVLEAEEAGLPWPHELEASTRESLPVAVREEPSAGSGVVDALEAHDWPRPRRGEDGARPAPPAQRPVISLLFSGGVFRGVFQMGVLNALRELGVRPDLIAGASVGSITAAMAAQAFSPPPQGGAEQHARLQIARLSAAYLAVDRLVLTDRFADFVRNFTVRAAGTRFSLRDADRLFRLYDDPWPLAFDRNARRVIAGLERLFYVSPYQLNALTRTLRQREDGVGRQLKELAQQWLRRMEVGDEILGAEPLERLIRWYAVSEAQRDRARSEPFGRFLQHGIVLLATATNLDAGSLEMLGVPGRPRARGAEPMLVEGLLTSSAFPGVFRPRWSWDLFPGVAEEEQYVDGGVMDNLPLWEVRRFLSEVSGKDGRIARRPSSPHLVFAASLEPDARHTFYPGGTWMDLGRRTKQLGYNGKVGRIASAERDIREIVRRREGEGGAEPLDLEVVAVKPRWLCGTFAFHPMLGFRRQRQAESIAHGCASTLLCFAKVDPAHRKAWHLQDDELDVQGFEAARKRWEQTGRLACRCWVRPQRTCPYSREGLKDLDLSAETRSELEKIHTACKRPRTHAWAS